MDRNLAPIRYRQARLPQSASFILVASLIAILILGMWHLIFVTRAHAHDAMPTAAMPEGWRYPFFCCSTTDCRAVPASAISERPEGYVFNGTGEAIGYGDTRLKDSPDGEFHLCTVAGADDTRVICLFVPLRGM